MGRKAQKHKRKLRKKLKSNGSSSTSYIHSSSDDNSSAMSNPVNNANNISVSETIGEANSVLYGQPGPPVSASTPGNAQTTANMDLSLHGKIDILLKKFESVEVVQNRLESKLSSFDTVVSTMGNKMSQIEKDQCDFREAVHFVSGKFDDLEPKTKKIPDIEVVPKAQSKELADLKATLDAVVKQRDDLQDKVVDLQCRSMKMNLIFTGLGGKTKNEDTESKLKDFIYYELGIEDDIQFGNVHRYGNHRRGKCRPVVARFIYRRDMDRLKANAHRLKNSPFGINEQFPAVIEDQRKKLYPVMKNLKRKGHKVKLVRDRLYVDDAPYNPDIHDVRTGAPAREYTAERMDTNSSLRNHQAEVNREVVVHG